jgi:hypothetical protein
MKFITYPPRIRLGLGELMEAFYAKQYPFIPGVMDGPQLEHNLPPALPRGGVEEADFHRIMCFFMLGPTDSMTMAKGVVRLYEQSPEVFNCLEASRMSDEKINSLLLAAGLNFGAKEKVPMACRLNAAYIIRHFDGNICNAFTMANGDWKKLYRLLMRTKRAGLIGYQEKMSSMLAFFLMRRNIVDYFLVPPQVDFHVMRVFWCCNLILPVHDDGSVANVLRMPQITRYGDAIRNALVGYELVTDQSWLDLSEALWTQSRMLCKLSPSNSSSDRADGSTYQKPIMWTPAQVRKYYKGCGHCSLEHRCTGAVPAGFYYNRKRKELRLYGPRQIPPSEHIEMYNSK